MHERIFSFFTIFFLCSYFIWTIFSAAEMLYAYFEATWYSFWCILLVVVWSKTLAHDVIQWSVGEPRNSAKASRGVLRPALREDTEMGLPAPAAFQATFRTDVFSADSLWLNTTSLQVVPLPNFSIF